ncbi:MULTISPECIES: hypothetical protein [Dokdonia]|jgi:hypothetical protein|uniref:Uncharacterized protein n=2 Tax=Dokdonia TaxID=326319 RepID=A0A0A2GZ52_9FLAO|nr:MULTISPECIES: hypothetical protein [Dokdonia]ANH61068.1 hypothetical protein I597_2170 [Dokdonia donghaensis DSW-1]EAQ40264.1 hypothetical protein MED134_05904 [Dokdonia sp. MED134]KGO05710.1 hypothetical protein NV36_01820 [Dokdonia donghaensis DSW-1]MDE0598971.1 hypothetical protein [Dokdonia donghaensis]
MKSSNNPNLNRVIVDFKKLTPEILALVVEKYPYGYDDSDIIRFRNVKDELVKCIEIITEDTKYLVKISAKLERVMEQYDEDDYESYQDNDPTAVQDPFDTDEDIKE